MDVSTSSVVFRNNNEKDIIVEIQGSDLDDDPKKGGFLRSIFTRKKEK
jgi:hypothetical protein